MFVVSKFVWKVEESILIGLNNLTTVLVTETAFFFTNLWIAMNVY